MARTDTHCPYCAMQCAMTISRDDEGLPVVEAREFPTNKGGMCRKGWTSGQLLLAPGRLTTPLLRDAADGELKPVSWDEALAFIVDRLQRIRRESGNDAVSVFGGGGLTNEKAYALGKFARAVLNTRHIDYNGRFCMSSAAVASQLAFGIDRGLPFPMEDLPLADVILFAGANPADALPPIMQYFEEQQRRGGQLIVCDPRRSATASFSNLHLQPVPGTDLALFNGLLHILIRDKLIDDEFIAHRTCGFDAVAHAVKRYWPDRVERMTGIPADTLEHVAELLGAARRVIVLSGRGVEQQSNGVDSVLALTNLILALGTVGKPGCGYGCLTGQGNGQGGREHGQKADQLPGYRKLTDPAARRWIASVWNVDPDSLPPPGLAASEMFDRFGDSIQALLVFASNPVVSAPDVNTLRRRLSALDLLVVSDAFLSETAMLADVVLPTTQWAEEAGTTTNLEGRVLLRQPLESPPAGVCSDLEMMGALATCLGYQGDFATEPETVFEELRLASRGGLADYNGISYARIAQEQGVFWPCPDPAHPGTPRLFEDGFATDDGRARFHAVEFREPDETPDKDYPLFVTSGRLLLHYQTGAQTRRVPELAEAEPKPRVEIHPQIARTFGIEDGDLVRVVTRRGAMVLTARLTADIRLDTLFVPFHWGDTGCANLLTGNALDPRSRIPAFKLSAGRIEAVSSSQTVDEGAA